MRDSTNQVLPYASLIQQGNRTNQHLKDLFKGLIHRQVQYTNLQLKKMIYF